MDVSVESCTAPENHYDLALDCDDDENTGFAINPDATGIFYDGVDQIVMKKTTMIKMETVLSPMIMVERIAMMMMPTQLKLFPL